MKKDFNHFFKKRFSMAMILMLLIMSMPVISIAADSTFGVSALNVTKNVAELAFDNQTLGSTIDVSLSPDDGLYDGSSLFSDLTPGTHYTATATESITGSIDKTYNVFLNTADFTIYYTDDNSNKVSVDFTDCYYYLDGTRYPRLSLFGVAFGSQTFIDVTVPTLVTNVATAIFDTIAVPVVDGTSLILTSMPIESAKAETQTKWRVINKFGEPITFTYTVAGHPEATGTYTIGAEYTEADRFDKPFYFYIDVPHAVTAIIHWGENSQFTNTKASSGEVIPEVVTTETPATTEFTTQPEPEVPVPDVVQGLQGTVIVNYIDTGGTSVATSFSFSGAVGSLYQTSTKIVVGYTLVAIPANASGSFTTDPLTINYVYSNGEVITDEGTPLGEAGTPINFDAIYDDTDVTPIDFDANLTMEPTTDEAIITDEETPLADALPQTGQASSELFFGIGGIISALGILLKIKIK